jgi:hypothetical protein
MERETIYAKISRVQGRMHGLDRPFKVETKRASELRRTPLQGHPVFSTKEAAVRYCSIEGWTVVKRWHDAGDEIDKGHAGQEGDSGRSITGKAACTMPHFSGRA